MQTGKKVNKLKIGKDAYADTNNHEARRKGKHKKSDLEIKGKGEEEHEDTLFFLLEDEPPEKNLRSG